MSILRQALSKDLHTRNMRPLDWGGQRDEQLLWKFLFLGFERVRDSALAPILKHCWQYYTSLKLTPTSHMVAAVIRGLNTPHQFQNIVSSLGTSRRHHISSCLDDLFFVSPVDRYSIASSQNLVRSSHVVGRAKTVCESPGILGGKNVWT